MAGLRTRNILWRTALLLVVVGAGLVAVLIWRQDLPWPGEMPLEDAALVDQVPRGLVLRQCDDNDLRILADEKLEAAWSHATKPDSIRLQATVWAAWGMPWQVQAYDRDGQSWVGVLEVGNGDDYFAPAPEPGSTSVRPTPRVRLTETPISAETAAKLQQEWRRSINSARQERILGLDGVSYYFRVDDTCASTWSPEAGTRNAMLTALLHAIGQGTDDARLREMLDSIPPPADAIPWPPAAGSAH